MRHWNVYVLYELALQSPLESADSMGQFRLNLYILIYHTNKRSIKDIIGVVVNRLVGMGLQG